MLIVQPDILYVFYIVINGRLEASGMKSVYCVLSESSHHNWPGFPAVNRGWRTGKEEEIFFF